MAYQHDPWSDPVVRNRRRSPRATWESGRRRILTILTMTVAIYGIYTLVGGELGLVRLMGMKKHAEKIEGEIAAAEERVAKLEWDVKNIETAREIQARTKFNMVRPNEFVYEVVEGDSVAAPPADGGERSLREEAGVDSTSGHGASGR